MTLAFNGWLRWRFENRGLLGLRSLGLKGFWRFGVLFGSRWVCKRVKERSSGWALLYRLLNNEQAARE